MYVRTNRDMIICFLSVSEGEPNPRHQKDKDKFSFLSVSEGEPALVTEKHGFQTSFLSTSEGEPL